MSTQRGFTLLQVIVAVALIGILMALATPNYTRTVSNSRRASAVNEVLGALQFARSEALKVGIGHPVVVCPTDSPDVAPSSAACSASASDWTKGWIVYCSTCAATATPNCNATRPDTSGPCGDVVLKLAANDYNTISIKSSQAQFAFQPFNVSTATGTITFCDSRSASDITQARALVVTGSGRPSVALTDHTGAALVCP